MNRLSWEGFGKINTNKAKSKIFWLWAIEKLEQLNVRNGHNLAGADIGRVMEKRNPARKCQVLMRPR